MIVLYTVMLFLLRVAKFLVGRRAARLEKRFMQAATAADRFVRDPVRLREGNSGKPDPYESARRQYLLGMLVQKRDQLEARYGVWQVRADRLGRAVRALQNFKGRKLPYTFGVLDVSAALWLIDYLGAGEYVNARQLYQLVTSWLAG